ncbi:MATE family efflux transporter [Muribaculum intestinale]|jgi:putative MATE family efflux protein|uniref:MATE family efflux transporter n=1 Tax=Muribaculum intestinale TaxID=1796646 RepID=UPI000F4AEE5C|nr:MATE family efflux transporter [Muribaculum intestinale]ROS89644.1 MATE family efflux transporter [Muribaculaceae bacterium Isolate-080 (Janvier)]
MEIRSREKKQVDMIHGPLSGKILLFSIPLIASGILQQSFNAIDVAVIGHYSTTQAIAAVGSNGPIISILVNLFLGVAVGANAVIATYLGQKNHNSVRKSVSTVAIISLVSGFLLMFLGITLARPILEAMSAPHDVIDLAEQYLRIFFCGMPFMMIYNFGSAIMRSVGDTSLPFYSLLVSTLCNLFLDWLFVAVFNLGVPGVAWATVISTGINAAIIVYFLVRESDPVALSLNVRKWRLSKPDLKKMLQIGVPAGLQGMVFSISNIFIQSAINSFGADAIAGSSAALTFEAYCYYIITSFCAAVIAFTGQNYGAGNYDRCKTVLRICMLYSIVIGGTCNLLIAWYGDTCISIFSSSPEVMRYATIRFHTVLVFQCLASFYEIPGSYMRALGYSVTPMLLTVFGTCVLRLGWVAIFRGIDSSFHGLLIIYPISWTITGIAVMTAAMIVQHKVFKRKAVQTTIS